jgi:cell division protein FtsN
MQTGKTKMETSLTGALRALPGLVPGLRYLGLWVGIAASTTFITLAEATPRAGAPIEYGRRGAAPVTATAPAPAPARLAPVQPTLVAPGVPNGQPGTRVEFRYPDQPNVVYGGGMAPRAADPSAPPIAFNSAMEAIAEGEARAALARSGFGEGELPQTVAPAQPRLITAPLPPRTAAVGPRAIAPRPVVAEITEASYTAPSLPVADLGRSAPARVAQPVEAGSASGFFVQTGAFSDVENAQRQRAQLVAAGLTADVSMASVRGAQLFRVVVGPWDDRAAAEAAKSDLRARGFGDGMVRSGL